MANTDISPNMMMPVPVVGTDPGPDWSTNLNACLSIIDSHNHTAGQGVPITPQGISINADLPMNGNNLITARSVRFSPQSGTINGATDLGCLYENGVDLYYIDGAGNQVRITQGGSVTGATGTITGLPSGTASAAFAGNTFTFQSATNTPAAMNFGPITLGQAVAGGKNVTISASVSQAANYALTLPAALPVVQSVVSVDTAGNLSFQSTKWTNYTLTIGATVTPPTPGALVLNEARYRRDGSDALIFYNFAQSGTGLNGSGTYLFPIPAGLTIDSTVITPTTSDEGSNCGSASGVTGCVGFVKVYNTTNLAIFLLNTSGGTIVSSSGNGRLSVTDMKLSFMARVPILEWNP